MKLRVRIRRQTSRVELLGDEPGVTELRDVIRGMLTSSHGLSPDSEFCLSLNGSSDLDSGQTLASCGVVSGDLICVLLTPGDEEAAAAAAPAPVTAASDPTPRSTNPTPRSTSTTGQASSAPQPCRPADPQPCRPADPQPCRPADPQPSGPLQPCRTPVWEPLLCSEAENGQAPLSLDLLYHDAAPASPNDAVVVAMHLLMLETGFTCRDHGDPRPGEMPAGWRSAAGLYRLQYLHPLTQATPTTLVGVAMGALLVVNATMKVTDAIDTVLKLQLSASSYATGEWPGSAAAVYRDLKKLSRVFKDQLAYPLIAAAREAMSLPVAFGLPVLPPELLLRVLRLLDVRSMVRLSAVSRHFNAAANDSSLWRHLFLNEFPGETADRPGSVPSLSLRVSLENLKIDTDWKELYKKSFKIRSIHRAQLHRHLPPCLPRDIYGPLRPIPSPLIPPLVPGIIGGEYDQRPRLPQGLLPLPRYDPIGPGMDRIGPDRPPLRGPDRPLRGPVGGRPANIRRGFI
ncbi:F-box only protein 7 [Cololabis saira]|uniref:F-box only protein 7 n=1 Tax=Cololabis saira TaxID=129043 RepID=UPI002AD5195A|nr:F-box only protein 7 [Cololabis saira]